MKKKIAFIVTCGALLLAPYLAMADVVAPPDFSPRPYYEEEKQEVPKTTILVVSGTVAAVSAAVAIVVIRKLRTKDTPPPPNKPTDQHKPNDTHQ